MTNQKAAIVSDALRHRQIPLHGLEHRGQATGPRHTPRVDPVVAGAGASLTGLFATRRSLTSDATGPGQQANSGHDHSGGGNDPCARRQWFGHTVIRLLDRLYGTALRLTGNRIEAEDVVAEAVARAWAGLADQLQDTSRLENWLLHVLSSTFIHDLHQRDHRNATGDGREAWPESVDGDERLPLFREPSTPSPPWRGTQGDRFLDTLHRDDVTRAVDALPEDERVVVVLVEIQGYRRTEVAEMLQAPAGAVRARLNRGRARLREALRLLADDTGSPGPAPP